MSIDCLFRDRRSELFDAIILQEISFVRSSGDKQQNERDQMQLPSNSLLFGIEDIAEELRRSSSTAV